MQHADDSLEQSPAAWRRPGVVFVMYAYRLVVALLVATPIAAMFGSAVGGYPRGDAVLFDEGGLLFVESMRRSSAALGPIALSVFVLLAAASIASIVPLAALIGALTAKGRITARDVGAFALKPVGTFALLFGAMAFVQAIVFAIIAGIGGAISRRPMFDAPVADRIKFSSAIVALIIVLLLGVLHDLARVAVVRDELRFRAGIRRAWQTLKKSHVHVLGAWGVRAALALLVIYAALSVGSRLGVDSSAKVAVGFVVYQASIILALFLRASWFASAIRHVDRTQRAVVAEPEPVPARSLSMSVEPAVPETPEIASVSEKNATDGDAASEAPAGTTEENSDASDNVDARA
jgi:hypothetical protein